MVAIDGSSVQIPREPNGVGCGDIFLTQSKKHETTEKNEDKSEKFNSIIVESSFKIL